MLCVGGLKVFLLKYKVISLFFLIILSLQSYAFFDFNVDTSINNNNFYTLPVLSDPILEYNFLSTYTNGTPIDSFVKADIIDGDTSKSWWDTNFRYRRIVSQSLDYNPDKVYSFLLNTRDLISDSKMRSDCRDLRIYNLENEQIPFILENCNSENTRLFFKKILPIQENIYLYYGNNVITSIPEFNGYKFNERFHNKSTFLSNWTIQSGDIYIENNVAYSDNFNRTVVEPLSTLSSHSELKYRVRHYHNSSHTIYLSAQQDVSIRSFSLTLNPGNDVVEYCWVQNGIEDCSRREYSINIDSWYEVVLEIGETSLDIYINGNKINILSQYYRIPSARIFFDFSNTVVFDRFSIIERGFSEFNLGEEHNLINYFEGNAFMGSFFFDYNVRNLETGIYSIVTIATRSGMNQQHAVNKFNTHYNRVVFSSSEVGIVSPFSNRFLIDLDGKLQITNNNPEFVDVSIVLDTPILIEQTNGNRLSGGLLQISLPPFSTSSIDYYATGISNHNPLRDRRSVLSNILNIQKNDAIHEIGTSSFLQAEYEVEERPPIVTEPDAQRKQLRYTVEGRYILDSFTRLILNKYLSSWRVQKGDIIEVILRVSNFDPFSREVRLRDEIPDEFVFYEYGVDEKKRELEWNFVMNKQTSRVFSYRMMYIGDSTGRMDVPKSNLTSDRLLVFSNGPILLRDSIYPRSVFVTKRVDAWNEVHLYDSIDSARVAIKVVNSGKEPIKDVYVDDLWKRDAIFVNPSIPTIYNAKWHIEELLPGAEWSVTYLTNNYEEITRLPRIYSHIHEISVLGHLIQDSEEVGIWKDSFRGIPFGLIITIIIFADLLIIGYYLYKNPFFDSDEEITPKIYLTKLMDVFPDWLSKIMPKFQLKVSKLFKLKEGFLKNFLSAKEFTKSFFTSFKSKSSEYYKERNISLIEEKSKDAISYLKHEIKEIKELSFKDWITLFIHYKRRFFELIKHKITYSMYLTSGKLLYKDPNSKIGKILSYSAQVINPDLKHYLGEITRHKMIKKEMRYKRELQNLEKLRQENKNLDVSNPLKKFFLRIKYLFKK